jgi:hypothetical protein
MKESDPKLAALIHKTVQPLNETDGQDNFDEEMDQRLTNHFAAKHGHFLLSAVPGMPEEVLGHAKAVSDMHLNSAKAHWAKHPEFHNSESFDDAHWGAAEGYEECSKVNPADDF